ncbi:MAG TPA: hypothetical protein VF108_03715 [Actinomycetota bacterium]
MNAQETSERGWGASRAVMLVAILTVFGLTAVGAVRVIAFGEKGTRASDEPITPTPSPSPPHEPAPYQTASFAQVEGWIALRIERVGLELVAIDPRNPDDVVALPGGASGDPVAWSRDGSQLILEDGDHLVVLGADGRTQTLQRNAEGASFSPDGRSVVYEREGELFVIRLGGGSARKIVATAKPYPCVAPSDCDDSTDPAWSPDGSVIAFIDRTIVKGAYWLPGVHVYRTTISLVRPNGRGRRVLISLGRNGKNRNDLADGTSELEWSPDGSRLSFGSSNGIYVVDADGSALQQIAGQGTSPTWSPNGKRVALLVDGLIWIVEVPGGHVRVIVPPDQRAARFTTLAWNPAV